MVLQIQQEAWYEPLSLPLRATLIRGENLLYHNRANTADLLINICTALHILYHTAQPTPHCSTCTTLQYMYHTAQPIPPCATFTVTLQNMYDTAQPVAHFSTYTAQPVPYYTTTGTTNHWSSFDHCSSSDQPVQSICINQFVSHINQMSQSESAH